MWLFSEAAKFSVIAFAVLQAARYRCVGVVQRRKRSAYDGDARESTTRMPLRSRVAQFAAYNHLERSLLGAGAIVHLDLGPRRELRLHVRSN